MIQTRCSAIDFETQGLARQFSLGLTGIQIDAIYHTSVVVANVEYFFGQGIQRKIPGSTHHGKPMEVTRMGRTDLPTDVIQEYIDSLAVIYTTESYDLFLHNCNNFSQDLSMFLVGKDIPEHIRSLPHRFLETPIGQMMRTQIDQSMRQMTQAPDADMPLGASHNRMNGTKLTNGVSSKAPAQPTVFTNGHSSRDQPGKVHNVTRLQQLEQLLQSAKNSCAVIFFTSSTCAPCKIVYPAYDELAAEAGSKAVLIKVDLNQAYDIGSKYHVRATPTFMTFLKGEKENEWSGANEAQLRGNVRLLLQMANPRHPHASLRLPSLQRLIKDPVIYKKSPPLEKLIAKIGPVAQDPAFTALIDYIKTRDKSGLAEAPMPNLHHFSEKITKSFNELPTEVHFAVIDLVRIAAIDTRVSSFLATETDQKLLMTLVPQDKDYATAPYNLQLVSLQLACNLFGSPVFQDRLAEKRTAFPFRAAIENLASTCLLASNSNARSSAAALVFNLAAIDHNERMEDRPDKIDVNSLGDVEAALVQAVTSEDGSKETLHNLLLAVGLLLYGAAQDASIWDLCTAMEVKSALKSKSKQKIFATELLLEEIGDELLGKGALA
jgi:desumoylating isopeptidase 1